MRKRAQGFTLLELMVVILLIGILLGMVSFATGNNPARQARQEASGLIQLLHKLREQAVLEGREYGVRFETDGYQVFKLDGRPWRAAGPVYRLSVGLQLRLEQEGQALKLGDRPGQPHVLLLSNDETSAFTLHLESDEQRWSSISSDGLGEPTIDE
ncbi:type II secretion system minor pseudopilin GspH [Pseudomonas fluorescens]|uniref:Type II secretion system protein H n=1 Tax=Pseudomonas fluorescens TaxID=294 RepID=A0A5E7CNP8_PSEFL|nr:type II secretion system minor pseudopilin GspH [Pseudomonas fluorescens]VVN97013.1 hypothetical protein PS691_02322 [Pseudomonas fluorescens]